MFFYNIVNGIHAGMHVGLARYVHYANPSIIKLICIVRTPSENMEDALGSPRLGLPCEDVPRPVVAQTWSPNRAGIKKTRRCSGLRIGMYTACDK